MPGFPALYYFLKFAQTHVHWVNDATQPSHPLSPLTLLLLPSIFLSIRVLSSESFLFTSGNESTEASVSALILPMNIQGWFLLWLIGLTSLRFKRLSRVFSSTTVQKHQSFDIQPSLWSNCHIHTWLLQKQYLWVYAHLSAKCCLCFLKCCLELS